MYRSFFALLLGTLRLLLAVIGGAVGGVTDVGHPYPGESDVEADRRWREEEERKRRRQTGRDLGEN